MNVKSKNHSKNWEQFIAAHPEYTRTQILDELRSSEYHRLDEVGHLYLDYTGGNLYAKSQLEKHQSLLLNGVFGNPHSSNPTSKAATKLEKEARQYVLDYFNAGEDYHCIFTNNASGALKIVGECYQFCPESHFLLAYDNHNSVNGIREYAKKAGSSYDYVPLDIEDLRMNNEQLEAQLNDYQDRKNKLFAFPAQSNVSGVKHPLSWIEYAQERGWHVLLDAAAYVPTNRLDLQAHQPDFVSISFYKIFGYPTGIGALLVKKSSFETLQKPWFAGGTVTFAAVSESFHSLKPNHERFENGTINYLDIPAVKIGLEYIENIGIDTINTRVHCLTSWLLECLQALKHDNGNPAIGILGPKDMVARGGTIILNFLDENGVVYPWDYIEYEANRRQISLRTGCFCNPGVDEAHSCVTAEETANYTSKFGTGSFREIVSLMGKLRGAVRISVGLSTNFSDVERFISFVEDFKNGCCKEIEFGSHFGKS